jgi:hypothetical protein
VRLTFSGWISEPKGDAEIQHHRIDGSGKSESSTTTTGLKEGLELPSHSVHVLVIEAGAMK